jgi:hypothetical protein
MMQSQPGRLRHIKQNKSQETVALTCDSSYLGGINRGRESAQAKSLWHLISANSWVQWYMHFILATAGSMNRRIAV